MLEDTEYVIKGILDTMKFLDLKKAYIGVEGNKPDAIVKLREEINKAGHSDDIEVKVLKERYPQGAERVMVYEITGKELKAGVLPADLGILLSSKIEETTIAGKKVFSVADGYLYACFDSDVSEETVKAIAQKKPYYAVFRDSGFATDSVATNFEQIFKT